jgi:hypothetical protein
VSARLEELRLLLFEERIDADLGLGAHGQIATGGEGYSSRPLRERDRGGKRDAANAPIEDA